MKVFAFLQVLPAVRVVHPNKQVCEWPDSLNLPCALWCFYLAVACIEQLYAQPCWYMRNRDASLTQVPQVGSFKPEKQELAMDAERDTVPGTRSTKFSSRSCAAVFQLPLSGC